MMRRIAAYIGFVLFLVVIGLSEQPATSAAPLVGPAGFWQGYGQARRVADLNWVSTTYAYNSHFTFNVSAGGQVTGDAVVMYECSMDDGKLRSYLSLLYSLSNTQLTLIPEVGALLGVTATASAKEILGMKLAYDEGVPIRKGKITGTLQGNKLHLQWVSPPPPVAYKISRVYATREVATTSSQAPAYSPWFVDADVSEFTPGQWQAVSAGSKKNQSSSDSGIWSAVRVGM